MLPFVTRNRKVTNGNGDASLDSSEMIPKIPKSSNCRAVPVTAKCFFLVFCILSIYIYGSLYLAWGQNRLTKEEFLETDKCPACYGHSLCFDLFDDQFELTGLSKYHAFDVMNIRNVHFAHHKHIGHKVVFKKLALNFEIKDIDKEFCKDSFRDPDCDLARRMVVTQSAREIKKNGLQPSMLKDTTFMFLCPTHRLVDRVLEKYQEKSIQDGELGLDDYLQILYTAKVNSEPLLLQTFPASEGWPFPQYHGACGRYIVVEHAGKPLGDFFDAPWEKRADLAYQMLKIAVRLTESKDWNMYWTDLAYDNFAVDPAGKLLIIDLENIIVVDKMAVKIVNQKTWSDLAESNFDECRKGEEEYGNCLSFNVDNLCTHHNSDHNIYATCRNILSKYANDKYANKYGGLLHDMPDFAKDDWDLENLLNECTRPQQPQGRVKVLPKLIEALDNLRNVNVKPDKGSVKSHRIT